MSWMESLVTKVLKEFPQNGSQAVFEGPDFTCYVSEDQCGIA